MWKKTKYIFPGACLWYMKMNYIFTHEKILNKPPKLETTRTKLSYINKIKNQNQNINLKSIGNFILKFKIFV